MSDVRDSGAIEQDASVLIFFTEDKDKSEMYGDPEKIKFIKAFVSKNRNGVTGYLNFKFTANLMRFEEVDNDGKINRRNILMNIKEPKIANKTALMDKLETYINNASEYKSKEQMCNYLGLEYNGSNDRKGAPPTEFLVIEAWQ